MSGSDPEETMPFTHRPFGAQEPVDPTTSPSGAAGQPSGADFVPPSVAPPPMSSPPYGPPQTTPYGAPLPGYGAPPPAAWGAYGGGQQHKNAKTAMTLGIVSVVSAGVALLCCVTLPGVFAGPFAWVLGQRAKREIDASPGVYANRGQAEAGVVMGVIGTVLSVLTVLGIVLFVVVLASWNWSLV